MATDTEEMFGTIDVQVGKIVLKARRMLTTKNQAAIDLAIRQVNRSALSYKAFLEALPDRHDPAKGYTDDDYVQIDGFTSVQQDGYSRALCQLLAGDGADIAPHPSEWALDLVRIAYNTVHAAVLKSFEQELTDAFPPSGSGG
jgi:hypothetical protein